MLFTSFAFWSLFILFLCLYTPLRKYTRGGMMLYVVACSLAFFYVANGWLMLVLPAVALCSWTLTRWMTGVEGWKRKALLVFTVLLDLAPLVFFKYHHLALELWNWMLQTNFSLRSIALPIGISFFTLQAISHAVDVYRRRWTQRVSLLEYLFFLSFFPLLLAGPITRAETLFPQLRQERPVAPRLLYTGLWLIMLGLLKKLVVADYIAQYNNWIFDDPSAFSGYEVLLGVVGFSVQIYCDFSGYSDLSIGLAALLGFKLRENFNFPYQALNLTEFWHRWHISLSTWFRDYVYIPLGGNRKGRIRTCFNCFVTMCVAGMWHGSTLMFACWGVLHGVGLVVHKIFKPLLDRIPNTWYVKPFAWALTYTFLLLTWIPFRCKSLEDARLIIYSIFTDVHVDYALPFFHARPTWCILLLVALLLHTVRRKHLHGLMERYLELPWLLKLLFFTLTVQVCIQFHTCSPQPFIYFQF